MNIGFLSFDGDIGEGGVQTVSYILATEFERYGIHSFLICDTIRYKECPVCYKARFLYRNSKDNADLEKFIKENSIQIIINNCVVKSIYTGAEIREILNNNNCKLITVIHAKPDLIKVTPSVRSLLWDIRTSANVLNKLNLIIRLLAFPLYKAISNKKYIRWRRALYDNSDKMVVLSEKYVHNLCSMIDVAENDEKVIALPNPLRFDANFTTDKINSKRNEVLIVSRLEESSKGLSVVFKIWRDIERCGKYANWHLTIVGSGRDCAYYKQLCKKYKLKNVSFEGYQNPLPYYQRAKIFLMTSYHEGLPMSVLEAQQCGVPVIAFNNYESITDIIINGYNGFIVKAGDIKTFGYRLQQVITNHSLFEELAINSVRKSENFKIEVVAAKWIALFKNLQ